MMKKTLVTVKKIIKSCISSKLNNLIDLSKFLSSDPELMTMGPLGEGLQTKKDFTKSVQAPLVNT